MDFAIQRSLKPWMEEFPFLQFRQKNILTQKSEKD
ncbi:hypothetical protein EVA_16919 [gut metagenome]|uniref:Uncharacterized protein n=1 Tax=gut metagenome TaxID=749906 RepID=J9FKL8_9ZZZZ